MGKLVTGNPVAIRRARHADLTEMKQLFAGSIRAFCRKDYTSGQLRAWLSGIHNEHRWRSLIEDQYCLLVEAGDTILGFGSLSGGSHLDFLYVHKAHSGRGIGTILINELLDEAVRRGAGTVSADVSITARPFFERLGFRVIHENRKIVREAELVNFAMRHENLMQRPGCTQMP